MGFAVARNKEACPSHLRVLESDRTPAFMLLVVVVLLLLVAVLLASAAGASAAAAAAAAAATALRTAGWSCSVFYFLFQLFCESYMVVDVVVQNPQKSNVYEYEKKTCTS